MDTRPSGTGPLDVGLHALQAAYGRAVRDSQQGVLDTLSRVSDAVVFTDSTGKVTSMNLVAETLTGWTQAEATDLPLETVYHVLGQDGRPSSGPAFVQVLNEGLVVGIDGDCVLVARDSVERPIEGSAAPMRNAEGEIAGIVLIFRDISERKRHESQTQEALLYAEEIVATLREPFLVLDEHLRIVTANAAFYSEFHASEDETQGRFFYELGNGQWDIPALRSLLEETIPKEVAVHDFKVEHDFPEIGLRSMQLNARRFSPEGGHKTLILLAIEDITRRNGLDSDLRGSELRFRRLFQTAKDGILILDAHTGEIIDANPFMSGLLGYEHEEFLGKELWQIGLFGDVEESRTAYRELLAKGYIRYDHLPLRTKSGSEVEVEFVSNLYMVGERQVAQCNIRDITQRMRMERQAKAQAAALADLLRRKDEFLAMLAHELRNPLSPILSAMHLIRLEGGENPIQQEARRIIERQVGQLSLLVDDLMEVARFTSGKIRLEPVRLDLRGIVDRAVESSGPLIEARRHRLTVDLPDEPIWLVADPKRLEQVVVNLLNNAAKYTDEAGQIWIRARKVGHEVVLSVRDTGVGIDLVQFPDIFDMFTQADRSLDRSHGGLGIGLSLVQRLIGMHRGTVEVRSEGLGRGSEFTVRLPVPPTETLTAPPIATPPDQSVAKGCRILVVDDNEDSAQMLGRLLTRSGHDIRVAFTGPTALEVATDFLPELVLLDIGLPGINGYEVARRLRHIPHLQTAMIVAMTGYGQESDILLAKEAGFDMHFTKPISFQKVQELVAALPARADAGTDPQTESSNPKVTVVRPDKP